MVNTLRSFDNCLDFPDLSSFWLSKIVSNNENTVVVELSDVNLVVKVVVVVCLELVEGKVAFLKITLNRETVSLFFMSTFDDVTGLGALVLSVGESNVRLKTKGIVMI